MEKMSLVITTLITWSDDSTKEIAHTMIRRGDLQPPSTWVTEWETIRQPSSKVRQINNSVQITELDGTVLTSFPSSTSEFLACSAWWTHNPLTSK